MNDSHLIEELLGLLQKMHEERGVPESESLENRNILQGNSPSDPNNRVSPALNSNERRRTTEIATLFARALYDYNKKYKKDEKPRTLISQTRGRLLSPPPLPEKKSGLGVIGTLLAGLTTLAASIGGIFTSMSGFLGEEATKIIEAVSKVGFIAALKMLSKTILKRFALPVLKKLPIIGGLIGFYFAYKAFKENKPVKGIAELISALLNFVPVVGPWLSIGADLLIGFMESKGMFDEGGALSAENGWNTIKGWMQNIGKFISDNALYLPIIGGFKRFGMAGEAFGKGKMGEGFKQLGLGLFSFIGGGVIIKGMEILAGWMGSSKDLNNQFQKDNSWLGRIKKWIVSKLSDLPEFLKVPMRWFGILDDGGNTGVGEFGTIAWQGAKDGFKMVSDFVFGIWTKIKDGMSGSFDKVTSFMEDSWNAITDIVTNSWNIIKEKVSGIISGAISIFTNVFDGIKNIGSAISQGLSNLNPFGKKSTPQLSQSEQEERDRRWKAHGWSSWEEYERSGWATNEAQNAKAREHGYNNWADYSFAGFKSLKADIASPISIENNKKADIASPISIENNKESLNYLKEAYKTQIALLGQIATYGRLSYDELKRMNGNKGESGNISMNPIISSPPSSKSLEMMGDNRNGYASSVYALA
jgi:hypothetical protein